MKRIDKKHFTLYEILFVIVVISILTTITLPMFHRSFSTMRSLNCKDSLFKLTRANISYAADNNNFYVYGAKRQHKRWHGIKTGNSINVKAGPLYSYFGGELPYCPELQTLIKDKNRPAYEKGGFGYGYNINIGSLRCIYPADYWVPLCEKSGINRKRIKNPSSKVFFTDTACKVDLEGQSNLSGDLAENAFCNPYYLINKKKQFGGPLPPTIHFRHLGKSSVSWADGHITQESLVYSKDDWGESNLGYIGSQDDNFFNPVK